MAKDALLGSDFMGNTRYLLNEEDMQKLLSDEVISEYYQGEIYYIDTDDVSSVKSALSGASNLSLSDGRSTIKLTYVMDMIIAFVVLILSVCLMIELFSISSMVGKAERSCSGKA